MFARKTSRLGAQTEPAISVASGAAVAPQTTRNNLATDCRSFGWKLSANRVKEAAQTEEEKLEYLVFAHFRSSIYFANQSELS